MIIISASHRLVSWAPHLPRFPPLPCHAKSLGLHSSTPTDFQDQQRPAWVVSFRVKGQHLACASSSKLCLLLFPSVLVVITKYERRAVHSKTGSFSGEKAIKDRADSASLKAIRKKGYHTDWKIKTETRTFVLVSSSIWMNDQTHSSAGP